MISTSTTTRALQSLSLALHTVCPLLRPVALALLIRRVVSHQERPHDLVSPLEVTLAHDNESVYERIREHAGTHALLAGQLPLIIWAALLHLLEYAPPLGKPHLEAYAAILLLYLVAHVLGARAKGIRVLGVGGLQPFLGDLKARPEPPRLGGEPPASPIASTSSCSWRTCSAMLSGIRSLLSTARYLSTRLESLMPLSPPR